MAMTESHKNYAKKWFTSNRTGLYVHKRKKEEQEAPTRTLEEIRSLLGLTEWKREEAPDKPPIFLIPVMLQRYLK